MRFGAHDHSWFTVMLTGVVVWLYQRAGPSHVAEMRAAEAAGELEPILPPAVRVAAMLLSIPLFLLGVPRLGAGELSAGVVMTILGGVLLCTGIIGGPHVRPRDGDREADGLPAPDAAGALSAPPPDPFAAPHASGERVGVERELP